MPNKHSRIPIEKLASRAINGKTLGGRDIEVQDIAKMVKPEAPPMPDHLKVKGATEWVKIWNAGYWLRPDQDYHWVEQIARYTDEIELFQEIIDIEGHTVTGYNGQTTAHPLLKEQTTRQQMINKALSQLGYSPTDRARLHLTELKTETLSDALKSGRKVVKNVQSEVIDEW